MFTRANALFLFFAFSAPLFVLGGLTLAMNNQTDMALLCIAVLMPASFVAAYLTVEFQN